MQSNLMIRKVIYHNNTRSAHDHRCRAQKKKKGIIIAKLLTIEANLSILP